MSKKIGQLLKDNSSCADCQSKGLIELLLLVVHIHFFFFNDKHLYSSFIRLVDEIWLLLTSLSTKGRNGSRLVLALLFVPSVLEFIEV
jgi:hypothetical protein